MIWRATGAVAGCAAHTIGPAARRRGAMSPTYPLKRSRTIEPGRKTTSTIAYRGSESPASILRGLRTCPAFSRFRNFAVRIAKIKHNTYFSPDICPLQLPFISALLPSGHASTKAHRQTAEGTSRDVRPIVDRRPPDQMYCQRHFSARRATYRRCPGSRAGFF